MFERPFSSIFGAALSVLSLASCSGAEGDAPGDVGADLEDVGSLELMLSSVPADAACLQVSIAGSRTVSKSFDLTPGTSPKLTVSGLPVGAVKVDANAYSSKCSKVAASSVPNWILEKTLTARIDDLDVTKILLKLIRNGRGELTVDFEAPPWLSTSTQALDLAIIGDTPYGAAQIEDLPSLLSAIAADKRVSTVVHLGDIKNGSSRCDDAYFAQIFAGFSTLPIPLVYTPGDNEWTDCHRANNGAYDPLERLDALRKVFFPVPGLALGGGFKQVMTQADDAGLEKFVENQLWFDASVAFGAVHVVGSNDSTPAWYTDDATGTKVDDPVRRNAERAARSAATLVWLDRLFDIAVGQNAAGVVIFMQADMFDAYSVANNLPLDAFDGIVQKIASRSKSFAKPVLLLEGDSHVFIADKPLEKGNPLHGVTINVPNLTRIVVQGSTTTPRTEWLRVHVDPATPEVFSWERNAR
jgi:Calcineurin-like phosphoesterase